MRLDELYKMTSSIYQDANMARSKEATFLHFVEVCALLTETARSKNRSKIDIEGAICKVLGWYFPLLSKMGVASAEKLIFHKYPAVCPYCRVSPHNEAKCKLVKGADVTVNHDQLNIIRNNNSLLIPSNLNGWQKMFNDIYPRAMNNNNFSTIALFEELGEIAEAIRVFDRHPHYFYGEAADVFSYIMGFASEHSLKLEMDDKNFNLETEYLSRYPGMCINCGSKRCVCPPIPAATIGRMTKESPISLDEIVMTDIDLFYQEGEVASHRALSIAGNNSMLSSHLPVDRGDLNSVLVQLCLKLSAIVEPQNTKLSEALKNKALLIASNKSIRGTAEKDSSPNDLLLLLREAWGLLDDSVKESIRSESSEIDEISRIFDKKILLVTANSGDEQSFMLRLDKEQRVIRIAMEGGAKHEYYVEPLTACTIDDFRNALLNNKYHVIHFAGHADDSGLMFCNDISGGKHLDIDTFFELLTDQDQLNCVILNACESILGVPKDTVPIVIGMNDEIDDDVAVEFSRGFYDALASGKPPQECFNDGITCAKSKGHAADMITKLTKNR